MNNDPLLIDVFILPPMAKFVNTFSDFFQNNFTIVSIVWKCIVLFVEIIRTFLTIHLK